MHTSAMDKFIGQFAWVNDQRGQSTPEARIHVKQAISNLCKEFPECEDMGVAFLAALRAVA